MWRRVSDDMRYPHNRLSNISLLSRGALDMALEGLVLVPRGLFLHGLFLTGSGAFSSHEIEPRK